jgi:DNA transformation protein and related proteins
MPKASDELVAHCVELIAWVVRVPTRRMFGGHGVYVDDVFVALVAGERLYLKVDAQTRAQFEAAGAVPFVYGSAAGKTVALGYFSAPEEAMESPPLMQPWARLALSAALRARAPRPRAARPAAKATARSGTAAKAPKKV